MTLVHMTDSFVETKLKDPNFFVSSALVFCVTRQNRVKWNCMQDLEVLKPRTKQVNKSYLRVHTLPKQSG